LILAGTSVSLIWVRGSSEARQSQYLSAVPVRVEFAAPELALDDLAGGSGNLREFLGRVVLVNLWATWCPPCTQEMPVFQAFYTEHRSRGFAVLAINDGESAGAVRRFVEDWGMTFPVWLDPKYQASDHAFRTTGLPTSYVIDRAGTVRLMWIGVIDRSNLEKYLIPILEE
jgi:thiol-disulfide isomerase/thioredoxin